VQRREVVKFRNKVVGHIWDRDKARPMTDEEINAAMAKIEGGNQEAFVSWCAEREASVLKIVADTRDRIEEEAGLTDGELFGTRSDGGSQ
jgi:hypothetical protein